MPDKASAMGKDFILFASKASRLMESDKTKQALNLCEAGVRSFPFYAPGHYILGLCYETMDKKDDARNEFERTLVYDPSHSKAMRKLSEFYDSKGLQQIANEWLLKEILYNPLDQSLINILKEKNLYSQLNPVANGGGEQSADNNVLEKEEPEAVVSEISEPEKLLQEETPKEETIIEEQETLNQQEDVAQVDEKAIDEQELIDDLDPLAGDINADEEKIDDFPEEEKAVEKDLNQFTNMEDDFSTIMDGYFDKDKAPGQQSLENDEWIEVENLLIDEEETSTSIGANLDNLLTENELDSDRIPEDTRDETELLLEELSSLETSEEEAGETSDILNDKENIAVPAEQLDEPAPLEEVSSPELTEEIAEEVSEALTDEEDISMLDEQLDEPAPLEEVSSPELTEEVAEVSTETLSDEENNSVSDEPAPVTDVEEKDTAPIPDIVPEPVAEEKSFPEYSQEEEVTIKDLMENPNLVTPTFGEILVSQHKFTEARHIFLELLEREPGNLKLTKKVQFLDKFLEAQKA